MTDHIKAVDRSGNIEIAATEVSAGVQLQHQTLVDQTDAALIGPKAKAASLPVTLATDDPSLTLLAQLHTDLATTIAAYVDGLETLIGTTNSGNASILAKLIAAPATAALQGGGLPVALGQGTMAQSLRVVLPSDQSTLPVNQAAATTGTQTSVAGAAADTTILAGNASRKGAMIYNDSSAYLYLLVGAGTSSTANFSVKLAAGDYFEVPARYTGIIKGIWGSATGSARVTEFS